MRKPRKRCCICRRWFTPYIRQRHRQKTCGRIRCRKKRHAANCRGWRAANPLQDRDRRAKVRAWARRRGYWKAYRRNNTAYRAREQARRRTMRGRGKNVAKRDLLRQIAVDKIRDIQSLGSESVAKRDLLARRVEGVLGFLLWKERVAKRDASLLAVG